MKNKVLQTAILYGCFCFWPLAVLSQIPNGYYNTTQGLSGAALKAALNDIISGHTTYPYTGSGTDVWDILQDIDEDPNNPNNVILIYKQISISKQSMASGSNASNQNFWNREHLFPTSLGNFSTSTAAGTDVHHLRPSDQSVNADRGNRDFDNGGSAHPEATQCFFDSDSWEPPANAKGDIARAMFYMATRYEGENGEPDLEIVDQTGTSIGGLAIGKLSTLLQWHSQDTVDAQERLRNNKIYAQYQGNRNPYIDHPHFVTWVFDTANLAMPEPTNHPAVLSASQLQEVQLTWAQPAASVPPSGYLIRFSEVGLQSIIDPIDGVTETTNQTQVVVGNVTQTALMLEAGKTYYFKIYPYNDVNGSINYKTANAVSATISL